MVAALSSSSQVAQQHRSSNGLDTPKRAISAERRRPESPVTAGSDGKTSGRTSAVQGRALMNGECRPLRSSNGLDAPKRAISAERRRLASPKSVGGSDGKTIQGECRPLRSSNGLDTPKRAISAERRRPESPKSDGGSIGKASGRIVQGRTVMNGVRPLSHTPPIPSLTSFTRSINIDSPQSPVSRRMLSESRASPQIQDHQITPSVDNISDSDSISSAGSIPTSSSSSSIKTTISSPTPTSATRSNGKSSSMRRSFNEHDFSAALIVTGAHHRLKNNGDSESISSAVSGASSSSFSSNKTRSSPPSTATTTNSTTVRSNGRRSPMAHSLNEHDLSAALIVTGGTKPIHRLKTNVPSSFGWSLSPVRSSPSSPSISQPPSPSSSFNRSFIKSSPTSATSSTTTSSSSTSSTFRSLPSPTRTRSLPATSLSTSMMSFQMGKKGSMMSHHEEALSVRILHNRCLQWCFLNARTQATTTTQKVTAERSIFNAWLQISDLRKSVAMKRIKLQQARQDAILEAVISSQGKHLEKWGTMEEEHAVALYGAVDALQAAILRVPLTGGARADVEGMREALSSAVEVMGCVESCVKNLMPKIERMGELVKEIAEVGREEKALVEESGELVQRIAALEIEERSLRTHLIQMEYERRRRREDG